MFFKWKNVPRKDQMFFPIFPFLRIPLTVLEKLAKPPINNKHPQLSLSSSISTIVSLFFTLSSSADNSAKHDASVLIEYLYRLKLLLCLLTSRIEIWRIEWDPRWATNGSGNVERKKERKVSLDDSALLKNLGLELTVGFKGNWISIWSIATSTDLPNAI